MRRLQGASEPMVEGIAALYFCPLSNLGEDAASTSALLGVVGAATSSGVIITQVSGATECKRYGAQRGTFAMKISRWTTQLNKFLSAWRYSFFTRIVCAGSFVAIFTAPASMPQCPPRAQRYLKWQYRDVSSNQHVFILDVKTNFMQCRSNVPIPTLLPDSWRKEMHDHRVNALHRWRQSNDQTKHVYEAFTLVSAW
eukprot:5807076-Pleurochrysis_carterae.AAC.1